MTADKSETYAGPDRRRLMQKGVFSRAVNGLTARHVVDERKTYRELLAAAHEKIASLPSVERIEAAIQRIASGMAPMRVPVDMTDPDVVLGECLRALKE